MVIFRVPADLMKSHFMPEFLKDLDQESFIHHTPGPALVSDKSCLGINKLGNHQLSNACPIPPRQLWDSNSNHDKMPQDHVSWAWGFVSKSLNEKGVDRQIEPSGLKKRLAYMT